jgi:arginase
MNNAFIVTPFFLDQPQPELEALGGPGSALNRPELPPGAWRARLPVLHAPLAARVAEAVARGERPVSIAGDCCTAIGVLAGLQRAGLEPVLIWLDAHGDFNTWETTPSGFVGGMPLAMLAGRGEQTLMQAAGARPLPEARIVLSDARDLDPGERLALAASGVRHLPDVRALPDDARLDRPLWVHFDTDLVDPSDAPAMSYAAPGGPPAATVETVLRALARSGRVAAASLSAWNPALAGAERTQSVCLALLRALVE